MDEREVITYLRGRFTKPPHLQNWLAVADAGTYLFGGDTNSAGELSLSVVSIGVAKGFIHKLDGYKLFGQ